MDFATLYNPFSQAVLYTIIAPGVIGLLRWMEARLQGRRGPWPGQPYLDLWKLFHRRAVIPETTSWVFLLAPLIVFGCYVLIGAVAPVVYLPSQGSMFEQGVVPLLADFFVIAGLMSLARFAIALAGMDTGSPFGGMGSSREMFMHMLTEPVLILVAYGLALAGSTTSLSGVMFHRSNSLQIGEMLARLPQTSEGLLPIIQGFLAYFTDSLVILILLALILVMLAETGRIPFDNPSTHLELTMIGKVIHLEYGGPLLALLEWAEAMRLTFFITLVFNLFFPDWLASMGKDQAFNAFLVFLYPFKLVGMVIVLAFWEETRARLRLRGVMAPAGLAMIFSMIAIIMAFVMNYL